MGCFAGCLSSERVLERVTGSELCECGFVKFYRIVYFGFIYDVYKTALGSTA